MRIILFSRPQVRHVAEDVALIFGECRRHGFQLSVNEEFSAMAGELIRAGSDGHTPEYPEWDTYGTHVGRIDGPAVMVCYGGDGTLLEGASRLDGQPIPVAGINSGRMGFLTSSPTAGIAEIFATIARGELQVEERTMLRVSGGFAAGGGVRYALNEAAVQRVGATTVSVEVLVDGQSVAHCHGDGVIISTPTGSTAYSLSVGGPVVSPQCRCLVISPIAPHNLTMRPVVVPDTSRISLRLHSSAERAFCTVDNRTEQLADGAEIEISLAERRIFLAVAHNISFYDTLRNKMMWGYDVRVRRPDESRQ